jgi:hypothetical protein
LRVLESFRKEARRRHVGYQTMINEVLAEHIRQGRGVEVLPCEPWRPRNRIFLRRLSLEQAYQGRHVALRCRADDNYDVPEMKRSEDVMSLARIE